MDVCPRGFEPHFWYSHFIMFQMGYIHVEDQNYIIEPLPEFGELNLPHHSQAAQSYNHVGNPRNNHTRLKQLINESETHKQNLKKLQIKLDGLHKHLKNSRKLSQEHFSALQNAHHVMYKHKWSPNFSHSAQSSTRQQTKYAAASCVQGSQSSRSLCFHCCEISGLHMQRWSFYVFKQTNLLWQPRATCTLVLNAYMSTLIVLYYCR